MTSNEKNEALRQAMFSLLPNTNFTRFIEHLRDLREGAMLEAASDRVIADKRLLQVYLGQIRAYTDIIDVYDSFVQSAEETAVAQQEAAQGY